MTNYFMREKTLSSIKSEMKKSFPEQSFKFKKIKYDYGFSLNIRWENGPSVEEVKTLLSAYCEEYSIIATRNVS